MFGLGHHGEHHEDVPQAATAAGPSVSPQRIDGPVAGAGTFHPEAKTDAVAAPAESAPPTNELPTMTPSMQAGGDSHAPSMDQMAERHEADAASLEASAAVTTDPQKQSELNSFATDHHQAAESARAADSGSDDVLPEPTAKTPEASNVDASESAAPLSAPDAPSFPSMATTPSAEAEQPQEEQSPAAPPEGSDDTNPNRNTAPPDKDPADYTTDAQLPNASDNLQSPPEPEPMQPAANETNLSVGDDSAPVPETTQEPQVHDETSETQASIERHEAGSSDARERIAANTNTLKLFLDGLPDSDDKQAALTALNDLDKAYSDLATHTEQRDRAVRDKNDTSPEQSTLETEAIQSPGLPPTRD